MQSDINALRRKVQGKSAFNPLPRLTEDALFEMTWRTGGGLFNLDPLHRRSATNSSPETQSFSGEVAP
jgi:hypothetical protein